MTDVARHGGTAEAALADLRQSPDVLLAARGARLRIVTVSDPLRALMPQLTLEGEPLAAAVTALLRCWPEAERVARRIQALCERCQQTGQPQHDSECPFEIADGEGERRAGHLDLLVRPWRDAAGRVLGVIGRAVDVTELVRRRVAAQEASAHAARELRRASDALQAALAPIGLPVLPKVDLAARTRPREGAATMGDWFDALPLAGGRMAVLVGDVAGHGVAATAAIGRLRAVLDLALREDPDPARAVARVERWVGTTLDGLGATVCVAVLDPAAASAAYVTAGHLPPVLLSAGQAQTLPPTGGPPLGTGGGRYRSRTVALPQGSYLVLFTDGLVGPGPALGEACPRLLAAGRAAVRERWSDGREAPATVDQVCLELLEQALGGAARDDATVVCARLRPAGQEPRLDTTVAAVADALRSLRGRCGAPCR